MNRAICLASIAMVGAAIGGCATVRHQLDREGALVESPARGWRAVATERDRRRLHDWRSAFLAGLTAARRAGAGTRIEAEGSLLAPDAAVPGPALPNGAYLCRTIKLGASAPGLPAYRVAPSVACRVDRHGGMQSLAALGGMQRMVGMIFPGDAVRSVFLGTLMLGDEGRAMQYGGDPDRDVAGHVERVGPRRWRLVVPRPAFESMADVVELIPAPSASR